MADQTFEILGHVDKMPESIAGVRASSIKTHRRIRPGNARDARISSIEISTNEVVRVELHNGFELWMRADDLLRERGHRTRDGDAWEIETQPPARVRSRAGERGFMGLGIKALDFLGIDLSGKTARVLGKKFEDAKLEKGNSGLYRCSLQDTFALTPVRGGGATGVDSDKPCLVFIHGTASNCQGSFGQLWNAETAGGQAALASLRNFYGENAFAYEHRSLTESPVDNALQLLKALTKQLPTGAELHLVSHSRGGMVGELLCLGERDRSNDPLTSRSLGELFTAEDGFGRQLKLNPLDKTAALERDQAYDADRERLSELLELLDTQQFRIRRFVRTACPARGTTLASGRLDRWLSVFGFLGDLTDVGDFVDFLLAVVKERTDPRTLPGLEAMMPGSALTQLLNHIDLQTQSDLTVISGDIEPGDSLFNQIKILASDWFYDSDHDLVVNTRSMYGGLAREAGMARYQIDKGNDVSHFNYFSNQKSVRWLVNGLTRPDQTTSGFIELESVLQRTQPGDIPRSVQAVMNSRSSNVPRPLAVVLPGTLGSHLHRNSNHIWLNYLALFKGGLKKLTIDASGIEAVGIVDDYYAPLIEYLARTHRIEVFAYDWRKSVLDAAAQLADRLEDCLPETERTNQPVHLIAHSMGGLVVRAMIADGGRGTALWRRIVNLPNSRFMMLGTPNMGSHEAVRWLTGYNPTQGKLALLDTRQGINDIIDLVRSYPGLLELLPFDPQGVDFSQSQLWEELRQALDADWNTADSGVLAHARKTWNLLLNAQPDPQHMVYVAGEQDETVADYRINERRFWPLDNRDLTFLATHEGDGTVTWKSGRLPGVPTWYVRDTAHDALCAVNRRTLSAYHDLLTNGTTSILPNSVSGLGRSAAIREPEMFPLAEAPPVDYIPAPEDLPAFGFGISPPDKKTAEQIITPIEVNLRHGHLAYAKYPVLVGHYLDDGLYSAEKALDERMGNTLQQRHDLGIYPGMPGTHATFFNTQSRAKPAGAIIVGLGQVGGLSAGLLTTSVRDALLNYALRVTHWPDERIEDMNGKRSLGVSCLLVGTGSGGISVRDSIEAILHAATAANARLIEAELEDRVLIDRLEFIDLYEDMILNAAHALEIILHDGELARDVIWPSREIISGEGRQRRVNCDELEGWWQRLEICEHPDTKKLHFVATTERARAEESLATGQLRLAENFIQRASQTSTANPDVAKTLFEMLLPNRLKEMAPLQADMVLLLDELSARYPWELLENRWSQNGRPPAVAAGMVRQFKTSVYRAQPVHATEATALVIGNPDLGGWQEFSDLQGARLEAMKVAEVFKGSGYHTDEYIDDSADTILAALHRRPWRVLHLAGHGVHDHAIWPFEYTNETIDLECLNDDIEVEPDCVSGMVIGKHAVLTPGDVEQLRWVPELVFINCCHLGKTQHSRPRPYASLAANLAVQFINMGVRAVIAAGWAVDDAAAKDFAQSFYAHMLNGERFGDATRAAREEIWMRHPGINTWGAYQCYGDPSYRLRSDSGTGHSHAGKPYHSPSEFIADIQNLTEEIHMETRTAGADAKLETRHRDRIQALVDDIPVALKDKWESRADVAEAIGLAWGETKHFVEAIAWLDRAVNAETGDCSVRGVEQCANFRVRLAGEQWQKMKDTEDDEKRESLRIRLINSIEKGIAELARIAVHAPTKERLNLLGSACKRLATLHSEPNPQFEALTNMANYYRQAFERSGLEDAYPFANWAIAKHFAEGLDPTTKTPWTPGLEEECDRLIELTRARNDAKPNFWDSVAEGDCRLVALIGTNRTKSSERHAEADHIIQVYRNGLMRGASPRESSSIREHLEFVKMFVYLTTSNRSRSLREAVDRIQQAI